MPVLMDSVSSQETTEVTTDQTQHVPLTLKELMVFVHAKQAIVSWMEFALFLVPAHAQPIVMTMDLVSVSVTRATTSWMESVFKEPHVPHKVPGTPKEFVFVLPDSPSMETTARSVLKEQSTTSNHRNVLLSVEKEPPTTKPNKSAFVLLAMVFMRMSVLHAQQVSSSTTTIVWPVQSTQPTTPQQKDVNAAQVSFLTPTASVQEDVPTTKSTTSNKIDVIALLVSVE